MRMHTIVNQLKAAVQDCTQPNIVPGECKKCPDIIQLRNQLDQECARRDAACLPPEQELR